MGDWRWTRTTFLSKNPTLGTNLLSCFFASQTETRPLRQSCLVPFYRPSIAHSKMGKLKSIRPFLRELWANEDGQEQRFLAKIQHLAQIYSLAFSLHKQIPDHLDKAAWYHFIGRPLPILKWVISNLKDYFEKSYGRLKMEKNTFVGTNPTLGPNLCSRFFDSQRITIPPAHRHLVPV